VQTPVNDYVKSSAQCVEGEGGAAYFHTGARVLGGAPGDWAGRAALALSPVVLRLCGCAAVRLSTRPVAMAAEVSVGYARWVGVWAWEGRAARGAQWDGMKCKERGAEWADGGLEREWDGRASGFDGARRARIVLKSLYCYPLALGACPVRRGALCCTHRGTRPCACVRPFAWVRPDALLNQKRGSPSDARRVSFLLLDSRVRFPSWAVGVEGHPWSERTICTPEGVFPGI
jgi:hypothetical protein